MVVIRNRVRDLRKSRNMGQNDLAEAIGVCSKTIYRIENDEYEPSFKYIFLIAKYFDLPIESVFTYVEEGQEPEWTCD